MSATNTPTIPADAVWFVTGTSSGIGFALITAVLEAGHRIVCLSRNPSSIMLPEISNSSNTLLQPVDLTSENSINCAFSAAVNKFGRIDVVVNNAGYGVLGEFESIPTEVHRELFEINYWAPMHITKLSLNQMRSQSPQGGVILQISSVGGFIGFPGNAAYHASKFALEGLTEAISKELDPAWNIRFTIIEPGAVKTKWAEENMVTVKQHDAYVGKGLGADIMRDLRKVFDIGAEPEKVAGVLLHTAGMPKAPFRLPLGADAWTLVNQELEQVKSNLNEWRVMSESTSAEDARQVLKSIGLYKD